MLLTLLLNQSSSGEGGFLALILGLAAVVTLFALSLSWLFDRRTRKRGLIGLGVFGVIVAVIALVILL